MPTVTDDDWDAAVCNLTKNGYRLPTETEWEYAARGGDASAEAWKYSYAGVNTANAKDEFKSKSSDANLEDYAWYSNNANCKSHEVGTKKDNTLGLYDMSGNVWEWCWDWYAEDAIANDGEYTTDGVVVNPLGATSGSKRVFRSGGWTTSYACAVSTRADGYAYYSCFFLGFRVCRSGL